MSPDPFFEMLAADDPVPILQKLRAAEPVHRVEPLGFWLVTRFDDVRTLFNDPTLASPDRRLWSRYAPAAPGTMLHWVDERGLFAKTPKEHARIRRLVSAAFTPRAVRRMEQQIREVIAQYAAPLRGRHGEVLDLFNDFTQHVPNAVISRITGVPPGDDEARFRRISQSAISAFMPFAPPELYEQAEAGFQELGAWVRELVGKRRLHPEEDLITDLVNVGDTDDRLNEDDIVILLAGIVSAGTETTAMGSATVIRMLLENPDAADRLRADPPRIHRSINEIIRFAFSSPGGTMRYAVRDFELRGSRIARGDMLMLSLGGANFDPAAYDEPERLDLDREIKDFVAFGNGPHYCLGANLARQEIGCMVEALLEILPPGSRVRDDQIEYQDADVFKRALNMPVEVGPKPAA